VNKYVLTTLLKLSQRYGHSADAVKAIENVLKSFHTSMNAELQQRSVEYAVLNVSNNNNNYTELRKTVTARMPVLEVVQHDSEDDDEENEDEVEDNEDESSAHHRHQRQKSEVMHIANGKGVRVSRNPPSTTSTSTSASTSKTSTKSSTAKQSTPTAKDKVKVKDVDLLDLFGEELSAALAPATQSNGIDMKSISPQATKSSVDALSDIFADAVPLEKRNSRNNASSSKAAPAKTTPTLAASIPLPSPSPTSPSINAPSHNKTAAPQQQAQSQSQSQSLDDIFGEIENSPIQPFPAQQPPTTGMTDTDTVSAVAGQSLSPLSSANENNHHTNNTAAINTTPPAASSSDHQHPHPSPPPEADFGSAFDDDFPAINDTDQQQEQAKEQKQQAPAVDPNIKHYPDSVIYENADTGLSVKFSYKRDIRTPHTLSVTAYISNRSDNAYTNFDFQIAVLKHVTLTIEPASSSTIPSHSTDQVTQDFTLNNSMHGSKKLVIRVKMDYTVDGEQKMEQTQVTQFPAD
jgi:hypothetical protein